MAGSRRNAAVARARFGDRVDRLVPYLHRLDDPAHAAVAALAHLAPPLARAAIDRVLAGDREGAPAELSALYDHSARIPPWVDFAAVERGAAFFRRAGILGGIALGGRSLLLGFAAPGGNKPLVLSGRLTAMAGRRLEETSRFVRAVTLPNGMRPGGEGFLITLRVRLVHAQVSRMILGSDRWRAELWGAPVNQHDLVATMLLFSVSLLEGLARLGLHATPADADDYVHLWRFVAHVIGVDPELVPSNAREANELAALIELTQGQPDDDSRALTAALLQSGDSAPSPELRQRARKARPIVNAVCRRLLGEAMADDLGVPPSRYAPLVSIVAAAVAAIETVRRREPRLEQALDDRGTRYWNEVVARGYADATTAFTLPDNLIGLASQ